MDGVYFPDTGNHPKRNYFMKIYENACINHKLIYNINILNMKKAGDAT
jgi:hypothetical protein